MAKIEEAFGEIAALTDDERDVLFDLLGAEEPVDVSKILTLKDRVMALSERSRGVLLEKLEDAGLMGDPDDEDEEGDEDEDEDDEDDGDDEENERV